jgi:hypothetical protein
MTRIRSIVRGCLAAVAIALITSACGAPATGGTTTYPPPSTVPNLDVSAAVGQTRAEIAAALGERHIQLQDAQVPFRPAEGPILANAPRAVYQAVLPADPTLGYITVYELRDTARAAEAAAEQQAYLATGPARVQTAPGTVHVIRGVGTTVIVYDWLPGAAMDPSAPDVQTALETIGTPYIVPG